MIGTFPYCYRVFTEHSSYKDLGLGVKHITQFLKDINFQVKTRKKVTYHGPWDLDRHSGIYEEPRVIIRKMAPNVVGPERTREMPCVAGSGVDPVEHSPEIP